MKTEVLQKTQRLDCRRWLFKRACNGAVQSREHQLVMDELFARSVGVSSSKHTLDLMLALCACACSSKGLYLGAVGLYGLVKCGREQKHLRPFADLSYLLNHAHAGIFEPVYFHHFISFIENKDSDPV